MSDTRAEAVERLIKDVEMLARVSARVCDDSDVADEVVVMLRTLLAERSRARSALQEIADDGTTDVLVDEPDGRLWTVRQTEAARIAMRALQETGHE